MQNAFPRLNRFATAVLASAVLFGISPISPFLVLPASAQTATTGALNGIVADPTGAVIPGATVKITDKATGASLTTTSDGEGRFSFPLLKPSTYAITATAPGMAESQSSIAVQTGQTPNATLTLSPASSSQNVTVSAQAIQLTDTQSPALVTTFNSQQVRDLPAPGGDITTVAFTVPGVTVNAGGSYGNFSADGLPGTSNLYVLNGYDEDDPFLNLNNSGSSNLTLGQGEIAEASVVLNGYGVQYGRAAGAIVNFTTKSGGNQFHGEANYYYNGDALNANDWFQNYSGSPRQKAVSNEWAANVGGPIIKNKLFFFADYEGLRYVLPDTGQAVFPSAQLQAYTLSNPKFPADALPLYKQAYALYDASPNYAKATPVTTGNGSTQDSSGKLGCGSLAGTPTGTGGTFGVDTPCETSTQGAASAENKEYLFTTRVDWNISERQKLFGRFKLDRGTQPTYTNFVSPTFNTISSQPSYEGQLNDTIVLTPHLTNQFVFAANWYTAYFGPADQKATLAAFPVFFNFLDGAVNGGGTANLGTPYYFPQGRNVTQYQFVDDLSWVKGNHTLRFGYDFRRDDISDYDAQVDENGQYVFTSLADFAGGTLPAGGSTYQQSFASQRTAYLALYNLGAYVQDEWQATSRLHTTLGVRFDRNGNPLCTNNCFARYDGSFPQGSTDTGLPYNQAVAANQPDAFQSIQSVVVQPRLGFNYSLTGDGHTVLRGGVGLFADLPAATYLDSFAQNFPQLYSATVAGQPAPAAGQPTPPSVDVAPASSTTSAAYYAAQSNTALRAGYAAGETQTQIAAALNATGVPFSAPNLSVAPSNFKSPAYVEFNLQLQRQISPTDAIIIGYTGNTGYDELIQNPLVNAMSATNFGGLPTTSPDPRFLGVNEYANSGHSNYNGVAVTYKHIDHHGLTVDLTYDYSHALDDVSNGGVGEDYTGQSILQQLSPSGLGALNYSNADYDVRQNVTADYVYQMPYIHKYGKLVNSVAGGWLFSGKTYWRTGTPFSIINSSLGSADTGSSIAPPAGSTTGSPQILAEALPGQTFNYHCGGNGITTPCFSASQFAQTTATDTLPAQTTFGNIRRNSFFGPHYADSDFALSKKFVNTERFNLEIGTYAFNVFNHPNFANPSNDLAGGAIGSSGSIVAPPTSPYGSFQSAGVGGRVLQVFGKVTF
jgi:hypothetical protein